MLNIAKIDSLKLRIPRHLVTYVDETFCEAYQRIYVSSGVIDKAVNLDKHKVDVTNGVSSRIAVMFFQEGGQCNEYIIIQCNAKQLKQKYFEGITMHNVERIYHYIMQLQIVYVPFDIFMHEAMVSDIDIAYDTRITPSGLGDAISALYKHIKPSMYGIVGRPFRQKTNTGVQFNTREKATPARPFIKIYHKSLELEFKSSEFFTKYIQHQDNYHDIGRIEFTIKNAKHRKKLGLANVKTFADLLICDAKKLEEIALSGLISYVNKTEILRQYEDLSPTDRLLLYFINKFIASGADKEAVLNAIWTYDVPQERSRMKKKLLQLLENVEDKKLMIANKEAMNFLRQLKFDI